MTFENEFEALVLILSKMKQQYALFKETLIKQRAAIIANDKIEMTNILDKIESIYEGINLLENRRLYNMGILAQNANSEIKTIRDIVKAFPEFDGKKLENIALELKNEAQEVKNISASNAELLEISRSIIKETIKTIMTQNVDPRDRAWRTYGNGGAYSRTVRREPVHLVNRQG
ncbi:MAG: flagellar protein FlgN [Fibromonadales bacterium]|nr:flagellar protein FlgN [Fibromonadales bacterium]